MSSVVVDTHAFVWYLLRSPRLSARALETMQAAVAAGHPILVPAICLVEIVYLVEKGRIPAADWQKLDEALLRPDSAVHVVPLSESIARRVAHIPRESVPDMPDRIIAATALQLAVPLVSRDAKIQASGIDVIW
jgi:PIN domain nuclease of toxin-antitoxin system